VVLCLQPGAGDSVQALKAGVMEIADIICINKADHPQAKGAASEVRSILEIGHELDPDAPTPPIVMTRGDNGEGVEELKEKIGEHREFLRESGRMKERHLASIKEFILSWTTNKMEKEIQQRLSREDAELMEKVRKRELDPISAAEMLYKEI
ncbi:MAG: methylmalonyl Co-A mutase-associated GTPase MeaB, partial [Actinobacteria bacterium]|nr:methylmalonyl Co-A mutase-associated GTPase MeaB [Actinomycetota bacterium]